MSTDVTAPGTDLLRDLLDEQQTLTAVERFAQQHAAESTPAGEKYYRDLIPNALPGSGEQYAFEVDLDACSGCKACVAACHSLNGLEDNELWRKVGQLIGGDSELPILQHVTTACHHCIEPGCLHGCPVEAYEKDPLTGIVRHLDDQCIGCQYCLLKCPYDVPVYSKSKGIVRKCDMCHDRLTAGEAPACVQSCPNQAIRISIVDQQTTLDETESNQFLPAAPEPGYTVPTTVYKSDVPLPRNVLPADYYSVHRAHGHLPLVFMLVLTQMSVGAFLIEQIVFLYFQVFREELAQSVRPLHLGAAFALGMLGLGASIFHLGRPFYAFRALLGLRTSWLSREILAFNVFAAASAAYVTIACLVQFGFDLAPGWQTWSGALAALSGIGAVFCSIMIYVDTRRPSWNFSLTTAKFLLTAAVLGVPVSLLILLVGTNFNSQSELVMDEYGRSFCLVVLVVVTAKLLVDASVLLYLGRRQHTPQKRSAILLTGELRMTTLRRFGSAIVGGILLPLILLAETAFTATGYSPAFVLATTVLMLTLLTIGELHERYLFFAASVAPKMPGAPAS